MLQILMRVEQEQKVTEDARRFAEQDAAAQRNASQVFEDMPLKCCPEICLTGRFGQLFVFFRRLSFYFTTVGFYFCTMLTVLPWESVLRVWDVLLFSFVFSMPTSMVAISSSASEVRLWDATSIPGGPKHSFEVIKAARFSNSGSVLAALKSDPSQQEILLYGVHTCQLDMMLSDTSNTHYGRGHAYSLVHFSPSDSVRLWNGVLWDRRSSSSIHRFDQFTDHGGGCFHPAGKEVIYTGFWMPINILLTRMTIHIVVVCLVRFYWER
ncbi:hypothetical protein F511_04195 [Dorcoceras hygrometricum]|uniref:Rab-GAP TBC domain-containing protein n=1 Tax=Dorcoceras hygrometricum TaxID=472368 RepID=A0A2Z7BI69_9LAMI|nr:hypothetical protein F511_04195 [Dorcoceras hygrometricum]